MNIYQPAVQAAVTEYRKFSPQHRTEEQRMENAIKAYFSKQQEQQRYLHNGDIIIDTILKTVLVRGQDAGITKKQYALLLHFMRHKGQLLEYTYILRAVWGVAYIESLQLLRVVLMDLRKKIEVDPKQPKIIITRAQFGYLMPDMGQEGA